MNETDRERKNRTCPYCHHVLKGSGHYVPPTFGDPGFAACSSFCDECRHALEVAGLAIPVKVFGEPPDA